MDPQMEKNMLTVTRMYENKSASVFVFELKNNSIIVPLLVNTLTK